MLSVASNKGGDPPFMRKPQKDTQKSPRLKTAIILLSVLLVISAGSIVARIVYLNFFAPTQMTVTVADNLIGEEASSRPEQGDSAATTDSTTLSQVSGVAGAQTDNANGQGGDSSVEHVSTQAQAAVLELYQGKPGDNEPFAARNLLPGDRVTKYFCVRTIHKAGTTLYFQTEVTEQTKQLGDVLHIRVTHMGSGEVLCDAPFSDIDGMEFAQYLAYNAQGETMSYYRVDVSLDTSVGNEYQAALLKADFIWYVRDEGTLAPPKTGDWTDLTLWITMAVSALLLILLTLYARRKKEDKQHG